jgi:hypothetical protein
VSPVNELSEFVLWYLMVSGILWIGAGILRVTGLGRVIDRIFERCMFGEKLWAAKLAKEAALRESHAEHRRRAEAASAADRLEYSKYTWYTSRKP